MLAMGYYSGVGMGFGFGGIAPDFNAARNGNDDRFQGSPSLRELENGNRKIRSTRAWQRTGSFGSVPTHWYWWSWWWYSGGCR